MTPFFYAVSAVVLAARKLSRCLADAGHDEHPSSRCAECLAALNAAIDDLDCKQVAEAANASLFADLSTVIRAGV